MTTENERPLEGRVALVAGATRGAGRGIAIELGAAGATVFCTGRSTRDGGRSEYDRAETLEETVELVNRAGGAGVCVRADHLDSAQVAEVVRRIDEAHGRLDVLVSALGGEALADIQTPLHELDLDRARRFLRIALEAHLVTAHHAIPLLTRRPGGLLVELTDGTAEYNATTKRGSVPFDLAKTGLTRMAWAMAQELAPHGATAVALSPGWLRSEMMLEHFGVTEETWREATAADGHFAAIAETPRYVGRAVVALASDPDVARHNGASLSSGALAREYGFTDLDGSQPDAWRYLVEVQDPGLPADATGFR